MPPAAPSIAAASCFSVVTGCRRSSLRKTTRNLESFASAVVFVISYMDTVVALN